MKVSTLIKYVVSIGLAAVIFYFVFRNVSFEEYVDQLLTDVNYWWVLLSFGFAFGSHVFRAARWKLVLTPLGHNVSVLRLFYSIMSGYIANLAFPRLGEVTRCGMLKRTDDVPISLSFGTVVLERMIDLFLLILMIVLDLLIEFDKVFVFFKEAVKWEERGFNLTHIILVLVAVVGLGILCIYSLQRLLRKEFSNPLLNKAGKKLNDLIEGLLSVKKVQNLPLFLLYSAGIWACYFMMSYVIFYAVDETSHLGIGAGLSILAAAGVAMATPVQGGIGAYHFLVSQVLILYGVGVEASKFFSFLLHSSQVVFTLVVGGVCMIIASFISRKVNPSN